MEENLHRRNDRSPLHYVDYNVLFCLLFLFALIIFLPTKLSAQLEKTALEPQAWSSISDGLAHNGVTSILKDSRGFLWIGTYDGLNRYDGYNFKIFKNTVEKKFFISNRIRTINEDQRGNLWIGTDEGISIYHADQEAFQNIYSNQSAQSKRRGPIVRKIIFSEKKQLAICATEGFGLLLMGMDYQLIEQIVPDLAVKQSILFYDGIALNNLNYLFATSIGLLQFNVETKDFTRILGDQINEIKSIIQTNDQELLVTQDNGILLVDYQWQQENPVFKIKERRYAGTEFMTAAMDPAGNLWLGTKKDGVIRIKDYKNGTANLSSTEQYFKTENGNLRSSCFYFSNNIAWVGTFDKGFYQFDLKKNPFLYHSKKTNNQNALQSIPTSELHQLDTHRVYVISMFGGIALFNTKEKKFESLPFSLSDQNRRRTANLLIDSKENIWLRFAGTLGFGIVKKGTNYVRMIDHPDFEQFPDMPLIRQMIEDREGNIWLGSTEGIHKIILDSTGEVNRVASLNDHPLLRDNPILNVRHIYEDTSRNLIWIGTTNNGLFRIKTEEEKPSAILKVDHYVSDSENPRSLSSNFVSFIARLPNGDLWLATERGGICKVENSTGEPVFTTYSETQGLSNNVAKSIIYDDGNLWIPTNIGLNKYNLAADRFQIFNKKDGLPFDNFEYAGLKMANGLLMFSSQDGFVYYDPREVTVETVLPQLIISEIQLFNKSIVPNDTINGRVLLSKTLNNTSGINLNYDENVFSLRVKSLHYSNPENHYLEYQLLPLNENWIKVASDREVINYNGLPPDQYTFRVRASNTVGEWTPIKELKINIDPPFWKTKLAYACYLLGFLFLTALIMSVILRFQKLRYKLEIEKIEKSNIRELNAAKLRFFSNISHEIKTPIALITGPVDMLLQRFKGNTEIGNKLEFVQRQAKKIIQLVEQVHGFQKADADMLRLKKTRFSLDQLVKEIFSDFEYLAGTEDKILTLKAGEADIYVEADRSKLEVIFNNLLSNAFKHTKANDQIIIKYHRENDAVVFTVSDTGSGIREEDLPRIFERFYQADKNDKQIIGDGIGLAFSQKLVNLHHGIIKAKSKYGQGSEFSVKLPIISYALTEAEKARELALLNEESKFVLPNMLDREVALSDLKLDDDFTKTRIFVAEDNKDLREFVASVLKRYFTVVTFPNGKKCLDSIEKDWPDLILSDLMMPELTGLELCRRVKSDIKTSHIPVILLTASTSIESQIKGLEVGADIYIKKPFNTRHLVLSIASLLKSRNQLKERFQIDFPMELEKSQYSEADAIFLEKLYDLMAQNLDNQELELDSFAKELHLNRTHFFQKVKALTNQTPYELLKEYRLKKAAELLVQQKFSVSQVYTMAGFKSRTHFSKLFKEKYEVSPGKYGK